MAGVNRDGIEVVAAGEKKTEVYVVLRLTVLARTCADLGVSGR